MGMEPLTWTTYMDHLHEPLTWTTYMDHLHEPLTLAFGTLVRGSKPDRSRWIFHGEKILSTPSFGGEVKPSVPCRRFTACKRSLNVTWKSDVFRQVSSAISRPCSSIFGC